MTHHIGEFMLGGEYERAVWAYLAAPGSGERRQDSMDRRRLRREGDLKEALGYFNSEMLFERMLLGHLSRREGDFIGALKALPPNLQSMFVHACQSFLFNQAVTRRCLSGIHPGLPVEGDIVVPLGADGTPDHHDFISVTARNLRKVERKVRGGKAFVSAVVMGYEVPLADGPMGEIERAVLEENGIRPGHFILPEFPKLSSRGMRREIVAPVRDLSFSVEGSDLTLEFSLFKGTYATSLLREYMKSPRLTDY